MILVICPVCAKPVDLGRFLTAQVASSDEESEGDSVTYVANCPCDAHITTIVVTTAFVPTPPGC
jgi:hypothetical protein